MDWTEVKIKEPRGRHKQLELNQNYDDFDFYFYYRSLIHPLHKQNQGALTRKHATNKKFFAVFRHFSVYFIK